MEPAAGLAVEPMMKPLVESWMTPGMGLMEPGTGSGARVDPANGPKMELGVKLGAEPLKGPVVGLEIGPGEQPGMGMEPGIAPMVPKPGIQPAMGMKPGVEPGIAPATVSDIHPSHTR